MWVAKDMKKNNLNVEEETIFDGTLLWVIVGVILFFGPMILVKWGI